jgi:hypothetical protein
MKPLIRLCDFYHIMDEREEAGKLVVTGVLDPQDMTSEGMQRNAIVAVFQPAQGGPKGSWQTAEWKRRENNQLTEMEK